MTQTPGITMRPFQLVLTICALAEKEDNISEGIQAIIDAIRQSPDAPITLVCNCADVFAYQDPGPEQNCQGGSEFNIKRDLEILYKMNLFPGATLPARMLLCRLIDNIENLDNICIYQDWESCPDACNEKYVEGREKGMEAIIPPRTEEEMAADKDKSIQDMFAAEAVKVRPHILLCSMCQYGGGARPPFPEDNLPELIQHILKNPETLIELAPYADWMMCGPCPYRSADLNACVNNRGAGGLPNQLRDLRVLEKLGLKYGSQIKAIDLYQLIAERIPGTLAMCHIEHSRPSTWWTGCGAAETDNENYSKGLKQFLEELTSD